MEQSKTTRDAILVAMGMTAERIQQIQHGIPYILGYRGTYNKEVNIFSSLAYRLEQMKKLNELSGNNEES